MQIAHVVQRYLPALLGGSERYIDAITKVLVARGHRVDILTSTAVDWIAMYLPIGRRTDQGINVKDRLRVLRFKPNYIRYMRLRMLLQLMYTFNKGSRRLQLYTRFQTSGPLITYLYEYFKVRARDYDLIHATPAPFYYLEIVRRSANQLGVPFLISPFIHVRIREHLNPYLVEVLRDADAVIAVTDFEKRLLENIFRCKKVYVVPMGIWLDEWLSTIKKHNKLDSRKKLGLPEKDFIILLPHHAYLKGAYYVLMSSALLSKILARENKKANIIVATFGTANAWRFRVWANRARALGISVYNFGTVDEYTKKLLFIASDVIAQPSVADAFGIVYLEAWASKNPVIAADIPAMRRVIRHGIDGFLVPFGDIKSLAKALYVLMMDPELREHMGNEGFRKVILNHDWKKIGIYLEKIYREVINNKP